MQQSLSLIFQQTADLKKQARDIKQSFKDALKNSKAYTDRKAELDTIKADLKMIEDGIKEDFAKDFDKLEAIKLEIAEKQIMATDIALNKLMKGETVDVTDDKGQVFVPDFSVKFKKTNVISKQ